MLIAALTAPHAPIEPRIVQLDITNQSRLRPANLEGVRAVANQIWAPYGIDLRFGAGPGAIMVVFAAGGDLAPSDRAAPVLGTTQFGDGHAMPFIRLSLAAVEELVAGTDIGAIPFRALTPDHRDQVLQRMLGVALAHELGHYLLDTRQHSSSGLMRERFTTRELAFPRQARLALTVEQLRLLYPSEISVQRE